MVWSVTKDCGVATTGGYVTSMVRSSRRQGEPPDSTLKDCLYHGAYPVIEHRGLVFAYMGPVDTQPDFPIFDTFDLPGYQLVPMPGYVWPCNWLVVGMPTASTPEEDRRLLREIGCKVVARALSINLNGLNRQREYYRQSGRSDGHLRLVGIWWRDGCLSRSQDLSV